MENNVRSFFYVPESDDELLELITKTGDQIMNQMDKSLKIQFMHFKVLVQSAIRRVEEKE